MNISLTKMKYIILIIIALIFVFLTYCSILIITSDIGSYTPPPRDTPPSRYTPPPRATLESRNITRHKGKIRLMVRDFISGTGHIKPYAYFSYLVITEKTSANYSKRLAAAKAFMCQFDDVSNALEMKIGLSGLAVFYAPVSITSASDLARLRISNSGSELLKVYNYLYAQLIVNSLDATKYSRPSIGIIVHSSPIDITNPVFDDSLEVLDLSNAPAANMEIIIQRYRNAIMGQNVNNAFNFVYLDKSSFANKFRNALTAVGELISQVIPLVQAETEVNTCQ